jgi:hypothetical protein
VLKAKKIRGRYISADKLMSLAFLHDAYITAAFFSPFTAAFGQSLDASDSSSPDTLDWSSEGVSSLAADDSNGLEHSLPAISSEHCGMVNPF